MNALKARQHHFGQIAPTQVEEVKGLEGYRVHLVSHNTIMHFDLSLNNERARALFGDRDVRQALFHAIDRQATADQLMQGTVRLANSPLNPTSPYHNQVVSDRVGGYQRSGTNFGSFWNLWEWTLDD